ncbi:hypothetical protein Fcan01_22166, partial [Folsomia candida]
IAARNSFKMLFLHHLLPLLASTSVTRFEPNNFLILSKKGDNDCATASEIGPDKGPRHGSDCWGYSNFSRSSCVQITPEAGRDVNAIKLFGWESARLYRNKHCIGNGTQILKGETYQPTQSYWSVSGPGFVDFAAVCKLSERYLPIHIIDNLDGTKMIEKMYQEGEIIEATNSALLGNPANNLPPISVNMTMMTFSRLLARFGAEIGKSNATGYDWIGTKYSLPSRWTTTSRTLGASPGWKNVFSRLIGICACQSSPGAQCVCKKGDDVLTGPQCGKDINRFQGNNPVRKRRVGFRNLSVVHLQF